MAKLLDIVKPGVVTGDDVQKVFAFAKEHNFAIPAVNCVGTDSVNAVLEKQHALKHLLLFNSQMVVHNSTQVKASNQQVVLVQTY